MKAVVAAATLALGAAPIMMGINPATATCVAACTALISSSSFFIRRVYVTDHTWSTLPAGIGRACELLGADSQESEPQLACFSNVFTGMGAPKPGRANSRSEAALAYLRVSGKGQVDGDGFPRQRDAVARYARANGVEVVGEYRDEGVSGVRDLDGREGLSELIERIRSNGVRLVLIERADRLARDLLVSEVLLAQFRDLGVRVIATDGGADLTAADEDPTRVLIRQVLGAVSQFEKSVIVGKLRAARLRKRRQLGRCEGRKPFGAKPGEEAVLVRMRQLYRKPRGQPQLSFGAIAARLNAERLPTRSGVAWRAGTVRRILQRSAGRAA